MLPSYRLVVECVWQGEWHWPAKGCDRWELASEPKAHLFPEPEPAWVFGGTGKGQKRRFR